MKTRYPPTDVEVKIAGRDLMALLDKLDGHEATMQQQRDYIDTLKAAWPPAPEMVLKGLMSRKPPLDPHTVNCLTDVVGLLENIATGKPAGPPPETEDKS